MTRGAGARLLTATIAAVTAAGCGSGADDSFDSKLPVGNVVVADGPTYIFQHVGRRSPKYEVVTGGRSVRFGPPDVIGWLSDGRLLALHSTYTRDRDPGLSGRSLEVLDPMSGEVRAQLRVDEEKYSVSGVTPEAITMLSENRLVVRDLDLRQVESIAVSESAVETDQLDRHPGQTHFELHGTPYTLDEVTWVQWGLDGDFDDQLTDHGVLRIEDGQPREVLRNEPVVDLLPSVDGSALLALMQDNGEDQDCGGCIVEQKLVELDPDTGEIAADYGMPESYTRGWGIWQVDKVGSTVVVQFGLPSRGTDQNASKQTWTYDGSWTHLTDLDGTRTWWQPGGRLIQTRMPGVADDASKGVDFRLRWVPDEGDAVELFGPGDTCPVRHGGILCPILSAPGSLIPPA